MNIDLLLTRDGEAGLVSDKPFKRPVAGVMFDAQTGLMTLEFADADSIEMNIPLSDPDTHPLTIAHEIHVGVIRHKQIVDSRQVPLVLLNDPFGGGNVGRFAAKPRKSVTAFERFMKRTYTGQPVHREDLGDEERSASVMGGISGAVVQFAPQLAQQKKLEASAELHHAPQAPGLGMGMGGGGGGGGRVRRGGNTGGGQRQGGTDNKDHPPSDYDDE